MVLFTSGFHSGRDSVLALGGSK